MRYFVLIILFIVGSNLAASNICIDEQTSHICTNTHQQADEKTPPEDMNEIEALAYVLQTGTYESYGELIKIKDLLGKLRDEFEMYTLEIPRPVREACTERFDAIEESARIIGGWMIRNTNVLKALVAVHNHQIAARAEVEKE